MKKILIAACALALVVLGISVSWNRAPAPAEQTPEQSADTVNTYTNSAFGIAFSYPKRYFTITKELGNGERQHYNITIAEDTQENRDVFAGLSPGREGPPVIAVDIFQNMERESPETWVRGNSFSNFKLSDGTLTNTMIAGRPGIRYSFDGLYRADAAVIATDLHIIMISGSYLDASDPIRNDFEALLASLTISSPASALRKPDAASPAAGVCDYTETARVAVAIFEDIPQPRCAKVRANQELAVTNNSPRTIRVGFSATPYQPIALSPGASYVFPAPVGAFLEPGVHRLQAEPFSGSEIWVTRE